MNKTKNQNNNQAGGKRSKAAAFGSAQINPFSRYAGDLPALAPAGKSTKVDQVVRKNLVVPAGHRALVAYTNFGRGPNNGIIYTWNPNEQTAPKVDTVYFSMIPTEDGECFELRASKSTLVVRNNTTPLNRAPYGYVFVGPNLPAVDQFPTETPDPAVCQSIFDQIYGRRETQAYDYNEARELINAVSDFVDYNKYQSPMEMTLRNMETRFFYKERSSWTDTGMTNCYFIVPTAAFDQSLDLEFYTSVRARYEIGSPLSRYATVQHTAKGKTKEQIEKAAAHISEGKQPLTVVSGHRPR